MLDHLTGYQNINVKVGAVVFGGSVPVLDTTGELLPLTEENLETLKTKIDGTNYKTMDGRQGSNLQAGVAEAQRMLEADTTVDPSNKYCIILADGGARMWLNGDGDSMSQVFDLSNGAYHWGSNDDSRQRYIDGTSGIGGIPLASRTFADVWNAAEGGAEIAKYSMTEEQYIENEVRSTGVGGADRDALFSDAYYTSLEIATYYAAKSIIDVSQSAHVVWVDYAYNSGYYDTYTTSFKSWIVDNDYATHHTYEFSGDGDATNNAGIIFEGVEDELINLINAGSYLVDEMGSGTDNYGNPYDFNFINDINKINLTKGGVLLDKVQIEDNMYGFGEENHGVYDFVITYYPEGTVYNDREYGECFIVEANIPITRNDPVHVLYSVKLINPQTTEGTYGVYDSFGKAGHSGLYTNNSATLYPMNPDETFGDPVEFNKPTVSYTVTPTESTDDQTGDKDSPDTEEAENPQTGDNSNIAPWIAVLLVSGIALIGICTFGRKRKYSR